MLCRFLTIKHAPFSTEMRIVSGRIIAHSQQLLVKKVKVILMYLVSTTVWFKESYGQGCLLDGKGQFFKFLPSLAPLFIVLSSSLQFLCSLKQPTLQHKCVLKQLSYWVWCTPLTSAFRRQRQADLWESGSKLVCRLSSRLAKLQSELRTCLKTETKTENKNQPNKI